MVDAAQVKKSFEKHFRYTGVITGIDPESGEIDVDGYVTLNSALKKLPVSFAHVTKGFTCSDSMLTTLKGAPYSVRGGFDCTSNKLKSLQYAPEFVGRDFWCGYNQLTNLIGAPNEVGTDFICHGNPLTSLEGAPSVIPGWFRLTYSPSLPLLRTLVAKQGVMFWDAPEKVTQILNDPEFKGKGRSGAIKAAIHLIRAGYKENARW